jgi:predicted RND superfamily exporter protein
MSVVGCTTRFVERFAFGIVVLAAVGTAAAGFAARGLRVEHSQEKYEPPPSDPVIRSIEQFRSHFGSHTLLVAGLAFERPIGVAEIELIRRAAERVRVLPQVATVFSVADVRRIAWGRNGPRAERVLGTDSVGDRDVERLRELVERTPIYQRGLVSADWRMAAIMVEVEREEGTGQEARRAQVAQRVESVLRETGPGQYDVFVTGMPLLNHALQEGARRDVRLFGGLTVAFVIGILLVLFRQWRPVVLAGLVAAGALTWTIGLLAISGTPMSASLTMLVPLILVLSVAFSVHYLAHFYGETRHDDARGRVRSMMAVVFPPSVLTGLTTAAGFLALASSRLESVRETGIFLAAGVLLSMLAASVLLPALLSLPRVGGRTTGRIGMRPGRLAHAAADLVSSRAGLILCGAVVIVVLGVVGGARLRFDANPLRFFSEGVPLRRSTEVVDRRLGGSLPLEIIVERRQNELDGLVPTLLRVERGLRAIPEVGFVGSAVDFLEMAEAARPRNMPRLYSAATGRFPAAAWSRLAAEPSLHGYVAGDSSMLLVRIACRVRISDSDALRHLVNRIENVLVSESLAEASVTGLVPLLLRTPEYMVQSQISSFLLAFSVILLLVFPFVRSWRVGLPALLANIVPLVVVVGVMGWLGIAIDIASIMIASIALGIIVDDTIHFLYRYRACRGSGLTVRDAIEQTYQVVGIPMVVTSVVLVGGFLILTPSAFQPTSVFGLLSAVTIATAFVADLLLLPALLLVFVEDSRRDTLGGESPEPSCH